MSELTVIKDKKKLLFIKINSKLFRHQNLHLNMGHEIHRFAMIMDFYIKYLAVN